VTAPELQHLIDRLAIDDVLTRYAHAIDTKDFDLLDTVFTPDARLDYRSAMGIAGDYPEVKAWLAAVVPALGVTQHLVVNRAITIDGDTARGTSHFHNPNRMVIDGEPLLFVVGGVYHDRYARTPDGWRITERIEETLWWDNPPPGLPAEPPGLPR
jgi:hypothetical protein